MKNLLTLVLQSNNIKYDILQPLEFTQWLQNHLLACPFKRLTGFDCPGCGFQRSLIALLQGDISQSLHYYPAAIPLLLTAIYTITYKYLKIAKKEYIKNALYIFTGLVIVGSYAIKLSGYTLG